MLFAPRSLGALNAADSVPDNLTLACTPASVGRGRSCRGPWWWSPLVWTVWSVGLVGLSSVACVLVIFARYCTGNLWFSDRYCFCNFKIKRHRYCTLISNSVTKIAVVTNIAVAVYTLVTDIAVVICNCIFSYWYCSWKLWYGDWNCY